MTSKTNTVATKNIVVCGHIHGTLSVERCSENGCRGCRAHLDAPKSKVAYAGSVVF